jgi:hypothetical protein
MKNPLDSFTVRLTGTADLIMHNGRLADPLDPAAKRVAAISQRSKKTDEDYADLARAEWEGAFYYNQNTGPYIPVDNVSGTLIKGAAKMKQGKMVQSGVLISSIDADDELVLSYNGPRTLEGMWNGGSGPHVFSKMVRVKQARIMRTRPRFPAGWSIDAMVSYMPDVLNKEDILTAFENAGLLIGLCDFRPRYGRFEVAVI